MKDMCELESMAFSATSAAARKMFADELYVLVYTQPQLFNLGRLDPDCRSEFLVAMYGLFCKIPLFYSKEKGNLLHYLQTILKRNYKSWFRKEIKKIATEKSVFKYLSQDYTESLCADFETAYGEKEVPRYHAEICRLGLTKLLSAERLLLFAFKSSYYLDETLIRKLAFFTGRSEGELWDIKHKIDMANSRRIAVCEQRKKGLNTCYILKNRYLWELERLNPESLHYNRIKRAYRQQQGLWLRKTGGKMCPRLGAPNKILASVFKMDNYKVNSALLYASRKHQKFVCTVEQNSEPVI